jgi:cobalt-precorrin-5B (C1)-methyltransferase
VTITLPRGEQPSFALAVEGRGEGWAMAGIVKDAGDDPDVTHGALVIARVRLAEAGSGVTFRAGEGVGTVTLAGLPVAPGEPAINPVPRRMMTEQIALLSAEHGAPGDVEIEISIPGGEALAAKTWNPRLGITGGLSILGTTGVVHPFSCSAWIHSIHSGIDVARAAGLTRVAGSTGSTSEATVRALYDLPDIALIDMGDFAGGLLKYLRAHPIPRLTIAGGLGKLTKLAQGHLDLHSGRSQVSFDWLADTVATLGGTPETCAKAARANTALEVLTLADAEGLALGERVAAAARATAEATLRDAPVEVEIVVVDRQGEIIGRA